MSSTTAKEEKKAGSLRQGKITFQDETIDEIFRLASDEVNNLIASQVHSRETTCVCEALSLVYRSAFIPHKFRSEDIESYIALLASIVNKNQTISDHNRDSLLLLHINAIVRMLADYLPQVNQSKRNAFADQIIPIILQISDTVAGINDQGYVESMRNLIYSLFLVKGETLPTYLFDYYFGLFFPGFKLKEKVLQSFIDEMPDFEEELDVEQKLKVQPSEQLVAVRQVWSEILSADVEALRLRSDDEILAAWNAIGYRKLQRLVMAKLEGWRKGDALALKLWQESEDTDQPIVGSLVLINDYCDLSRIEQDAKKHDGLLRVPWKRMIQLRSAYGNITPRFEVASMSSSATLASLKECQDQEYFASAMGVLFTQVAEDAQRRADEDIFAGRQDIDPTLAIASTPQLFAGTALTFTEHAELEALVAKQEAKGAVAGTQVRVARDLFEISYASFNDADKVKYLVARKRLDGGGLGRFGANTRVEELLANGRSGQLTVPDLQSLVINFPELASKNYEVLNDAFLPLQLRIINENLRMAGDLGVPESDRNRALTNLMTLAAATTGIFSSSYTHRFSDQQLLETLALALKCRPGDFDFMKSLINEGRLRHLFDQSLVALFKKFNAASPESFAKSLRDLTAFDSDPREDARKRVMLISAFKDDQKIVNLLLTRPQWSFWSWRSEAREPCASLLENPRSLVRLFETDSFEFNQFCFVHQDFFEATRKAVCDHVVDQFPEAFTPIPEGQVLAPKVLISKYSRVLAYCLRNSVNRQILEETSADPSKLLSQIYPEVFRDEQLVSQQGPLPSVLDVLRKYCDNKLMGLGYVSTGEEKLKSEAREKAKVVLGEVIGIISNFCFASIFWTNLSEEGKNAVRFLTTDIMIDVETLCNRLPELTQDDEVFQRILELIMTLRRDAVLVEKYDLSTSKITLVPERLIKLFCERDAKTDLPAKLLKDPVGPVSADQAFQVSLERLALFNRYFLFKLNDQKTDDSLVDKYLELLPEIAEQVRRFSQVRDDALWDDSKRLLIRVWPEIVRKWSLLNQEKKASLKVVVDTTLVGSKAAMLDAELLNIEGRDVRAQCVIIGRCLHDLHTLQFIHDQASEVKELKFAEIGEKGRTQVVTREFLKLDFDQKKDFVLKTADLSRGARISKLEQSEIAYLPAFEAAISGWLLDLSSRTNALPPGNVEKWKETVAKFMGQLKAYIESPHLSDGKEGLAKVSPKNIGVAFGKICMMREDILQGVREFEKIVSADRPTVAGILGQSLSQTIQQPLQRTAQSDGNKSKELNSTHEGVMASLRYHLHS